MVIAKGFSVESRYIPKGAVKVADKKSDAVAYLYNITINGNDLPAARVFWGKQSKPVLACWFAPFKDKTAEQQRATRVAQYFQRRQEVLGWKAEQKAKDKAAAVEAAKKAQPGAYFYTSWGYEQTNIDWYRIEKLIGSTMALVTKVAPMDASKGNEPSMTGKSVPSDTAVGEPFKVRLKGGASAFKVGNQYAYPWDGTPKSWTAYA